MHRRSFLALASLALVFPLSARAEEAPFLAPPQYIGPPKAEHAATNRAFQGIPSMAIAPGGRLWADWYAGLTPGEDANNYVVLSASGDGGATWQEVLVIDPDGSGPVRAYDPELWLAPGGRLFVFWTQAEGHLGTVAGVWCMETAEPDAAQPKWSAPRRLTDGVMMDKPLVLSNGEWVLPASTWRETDQSARMIVSSDAGKTWALRGACNVPKAAREFDEHEFIERKDGSLWLLVRTKYGIGESISTDRGRTWPELTPSALAHPSSRFFIRRLASGHLLLVKHGPIAEKTGRSRLTAFLSADEGKTWSGGLLLDERNGVSYPDGQQAADGLIRVIYDFSRTGARQILMAAFREEDVAAGHDVSGAVKLRQVVSEASGGQEKPRAQSRGKAAPISLHPENPHYFLYHDKPAVLITSGEHYGAVLNLDFDYIKYLDTLAADGLNLTRTFSGAYVEPQGAFKIAENTLAPKPERFLGPWARSGQAGYANGGHKFDLSQWDAAYFARLKDFVAQAGRRGIVVELTLFCPMYSDAQWNLSPMNAANHIGEGVGEIGRDEVYTLDKNGGLLAVQEALARKIVAELRDADNVCYEICNEPYFGGVTMEWQRHIAEIITEAEKDFTHRHLLTQNIANRSKKIEAAFPEVSVFNFHYASPPTAVALNYALKKAIGDNETGFKGTADDLYRTEAWEFILAGGALFNNLDYSFTVGHEDGTFAYPPTQPGGGNPGFRKQVKLLKDFIQSFDFVKMKPARDLLPKDADCQMLAEPGSQYAAYFRGAAKLDFTLDLPAGDYRVLWLDVVTGREAAMRRVVHPGGPARFHVPEDLHECALKIVRALD
jgi:hypothetical protein